MLRGLRLIKSATIPFRIKNQIVNHYSVRGLQPEPGSTSFWSRLLGKYLLVTNTVGLGLLLVVGDAVSQQYERLEKKDKVQAKEKLDISRTVRMLLTGLLIGPIQHAFYVRLDQYFTDTSRLGVMRKIFVDQLIMSPTYIFLFFYISSLLEGHTIKEANDEIADKFLMTWKLDCCFWPGLQYFNFRYLNARYRVVFINVTNCIYVVLLSYIKHAYGKNWED
ncbi:mpv17-like protein 2 isoform X1 [Drosophila bipectinata]|uniref:mpv17-like protein 2 isoform X1 n=1 Tax=Drosophila bipectinata TaxID=42026 RepID=UPI001C88E37B|nr:mpv17-like protein 2 [Drosophila bipectinata]